MGEVASLVLPMLTADDVDGCLMTCTTYDALFCYEHLDENDLHHPNQSDHSGWSLTLSGWDGNRYIAHCYQSSAVKHYTVEFDVDVMEPNWQPLQSCIQDDSTLACFSNASTTVGRKRTTKPTAHSSRRVYKRRV